jgi:hypothetical protein
LKVWNEPNRKALDYIVGKEVFAYKPLKIAKKRGKTGIFGLFGKHRHYRVALANAGKGFG